MPNAHGPVTSPPELEVSEAREGEIRILLRGDWRTAPASPPAAVLDRIGGEPPVRKISFEAAALAGWSSPLLAHIAVIEKRSRARGIEVDRAGLPEGMRTLLELAAASPARKDAGPPQPQAPLLARLGARALGGAGKFLEVLDFIGQIVVAAGRLLLGRSRLRKRDILLFFQECGGEAVPIVSLISFLVGLIIAFIGVIQLQAFGAQIYVADLVGISMVRVLGAVMTGVIMTGRTGASFAARIGTMQVNEEIDALRTLGISPVDFLVLPRLIALIIAMPLLCLYADLMGVLGGFAVAVLMLDIGPLEYVLQTRSAVTLNHVAIGVVHSTVFGVLIAATGCLRGLQCGRSSAAVGTATTSAVVSGIVSIVIATAILTLTFRFLGI
jgi:phospholipid/cholesterol/gamma-HCH transport system permease protein